MRGIIVFRFILLLCKCSSLCPAFSFENKREEVENTNETPFVGFSLKSNHFTESR